LLTFSTMPPLTVQEHQAFPLSIQALDGTKQPSVTFGGTVKLTSSWGDVSPAEVTLSAGKATTMVSLNRETLSPATATITATFADKYKGASPKVNVNAPEFAVDATETASAPFGWATIAIAQPNVVKKGATTYMYFYGRALNNIAGIGVASSTDGKVFTANAAPVFPTDVQSPTVYFRGDKAYMAWDKVLEGVANPSFISLSSAAGPTLAFAPLGGPPAVAPQQCAYCKHGVSFPQVFEDITQPADDKGERPLVMFFAATDENNLVAFGRASSTDGITWTPEPAPILSADLTDEAVLMSPRVLLDGTVFKMWYTFARIANVPSRSCTLAGTCLDPRFTCLNKQCVNLNDPLEFFCDTATKVEIGYATSADGFFWTRSPKNPVLTVATVGGNARSLLTGSVIAQDGVNASSGIVMHFSTWKPVLGRCVPSGFLRANRP
jgi:hypothetical protein